MEKNFAYTPTVSIGRSKFDRISSHKTSFNLGEIIPLYVDEVLPGDTRSLNVSSLIRMSTPIAPIMDDIVYEIFAFFVPNRLVWENWKEFMGESPNAGVSTAPERYVPKIALDIVTPKKIGSYMGLPVYSKTGTDKVDVSMLPLRAYCAIYDRWFRNQNVQNPFYLPVDDTGVPHQTIGGVSIPVTYNTSPLTAYKKADYFTSCLPYAQKGSPVQIPLNGLVPVVTLPQTHNIVTGTQFNFVDSSNGGSIYDGNLSVANGGLIRDAGSGGAYAQTAVPNNLWADIESNANMTVNQVRLAFATQRLLEKDALYGSRYWEILYGHFGVRSPDASLQDPEYLGGMKFYINVDQVLQTTGFSTTPGSNSLGTPGANSVTGNNGSLFTKSFVEHGTLMVLGVARQRTHTYCQGVNRMWSRSRRLDFYFPTFANLGSQDVLNKEIKVDSATTNDKMFAMQEAWAEYRFKPSIATGDLDVSQSGSLDYWTLTDNLASVPTLSQSFLLEDRSNLSRCLVTGATGPDFIADFLFDDVAVRPMPLYSVPGLIDHH